MKLKFAIALVITLLFGRQALPAGNAAGSLDPSFGTGGKLLTPIGGNDQVFNAVAIQPDGKIVAVGYDSSASYPYNDFLVSRFNSDGTPDSTFGGGSGYVTTDLVGDGDAATAVAIQSDGKIIAGGYSCADPGCSTNAIYFGLARYNTDGSLDMNFATFGTQIFGVSFGNARIAALAVEPVTGAIYAVGSGQTGPAYTDVDFIVVKFDATGLPVNTFGSSALLAIDFFGGDDEATSAGIQSDGNIVVAGFASSPTNSDDFALARFSPDGILDGAFGIGGKVTTDFAGGYDKATGVAIQSDGKIVASGFAFLGNLDSDFALARYNTNGSLDTTFGTLGRVATSFAAGISYLGSALFLQPDGELAVAGFSHVDSTDAIRISLARFSTDGTVDQTFGNGGLVTLSLSSLQASQATGLAEQSDGKIVISASVGGNTSGADALLARFSAGGILDQTFGTNGMIQIADLGAVTDSANGVAIQADGKIVAAGFTSSMFALARYNKDGTLDGTFGAGGKMTTLLGTDSEAEAVAIQPDQKIVVAGTSASAVFAVARYDSFGFLDQSFGTYGYATADFGNNSVTIPYAVALQSDGKIVLAGYVGAAGTGYPDFALARFNADGSIDSTFGTNGLVETDLTSNDDEARAVAIQTDGKIVAAGFRTLSDYSYDVAVVRYNSDGTLDSGFGSGGIVTFDASGAAGDDFLNAVIIQPDGLIVAAGAVYSSSTFTKDFLLVRLGANGTPDPAFGTSGLVSTDFFGDTDIAASIVLQPDGKIVAAGQVISATTAGDFGLARYNSDGTLDSSFGTGGLVSTDFGFYNDAALGLALQADGNLVAAGFGYAAATSPTGVDFALARYLGGEGRNVKFFTLPPCRLIDTRQAAGTYGGPPLQGNGAQRTFPVTGQCGLPAGASAISANLTVVNPSGAGDLRLFPAGTGTPSASTINFRAGKTRANNAIIPLTSNPTGSMTVQCDITGGSTNLLFDINGYFQ